MGANSLYSEKDFSLTIVNNDFLLTVQGEGNGTGWVVSSPSGISCSINGTTETGDCSEIYINGTQVRLTADPTGGSIFSGWSGGGCGDANPCTVTMNQAYTVTAYFYVPGPPEIHNISAQWSHYSTTCEMSDGTKFTGNVYDVRFYYDDPDGDVIKNQGETAVFDGASDITQWTWFSGDGFNGSVLYHPCYPLRSTFPRYVTMSLRDASGNTSKRLSTQLSAPPPPPP